MSVAVKLIFVLFCWKSVQSDCSWERRVIGGELTVQESCALLNCESSEGQACLTPLDYRQPNIQLTVETPLEICCISDGTSHSLFVDQDPISSVFCGVCAENTNNIENVETFDQNCDIKCQKTELEKAGVPKEQIEEIERKMQHFPQNANSLFFEGDILLSPDILDFLINRPEQASSSRKITGNLFEKWKHTIFFEISTDFSVQMEARILSAVDLWETHTCFTFELYGPGVTKPVDSNPILSFVTSSTGCWSSLGMVPNTDRQQIGLLDDGTEYCPWGSVVHEIGHALGLFHEQSRSDRHNYIDINWNLIPDDRLSQFFKCIKFIKTIYSITTELTEEQRDGICIANVPYSYGSIMHYPANAFLVDENIEDYYYFYDERDSIKTRDPKFMRTIGARDDISPYDMLQVNLHHCGETCTEEENTVCKNEGYANPNDCTTCNCCDGFTGAECEIFVEDQQQGCGEQLQVTSTQWTELKYEFVAEQPAENCYWLLKAETGKRIVVQLVATSDSNSFFTETTSCQDHYVSINTNSKICMPGFRQCGTNTYKTRTVSKSNRVLIKARTNWVHSTWSFTLRYRRVRKCTTFEK